MKASDVIKSYNEARKIAGTAGDGTPCWQYLNGWYSIGYGKYRKAQVIEMTENLIRRAAQRTKSDEI